MGTSTHVVGFRPSDDQWEKMKSIWESCAEMGVDIPEQVGEFFSYEAPGDKQGQEVDISCCHREFGNNGSWGIEIEVAEIPKGVKFIRVYNSY